jgi:hypothetical protein
MIVRPGSRVPVVDNAILTEVRRGDPGASLALADRWDGKSCCDQAGPANASGKGIAQRLAIASSKMPTDFTTCSSSIRGS